MVVASAAKTPEYPAGGGAIPMVNGRWVVRSFHHSVVTAGLKALIITPLLILYPADLFGASGSMMTFAYIAAAIATAAALWRCSQIRLVIDDWGIESRDFWRPLYMSWDEMDLVCRTGGDLLNINFGTEIAFVAYMPSRSLLGRRLINSAATSYLPQSKRDDLCSLLSDYAEAHDVEFNLRIAPNGNWDSMR